MYNELLVIADTLVEPPSEVLPSEVLPFRTVTMICHENLSMEILLHTTQEMKDLYYHWMKPRGMLDYVSYFLNELEWEDSIRVDVVGIYPNSVVTKAIRIENQLSILGEIKSLSGK